MKNIETVQECWEVYMKICKPELAKNTIQYQAMREVFFSGAVGIVTLQLQITSKYESKKAKDKFDDLKNECFAFLNKACQIEP